MIDVSVAEGNQLLIVRSIVPLQHRGGQEGGNLVQETLEALRCSSIVVGALIVTGGEEGRGWQLVAITGHYQLLASQNRWDRVVGEYLRRLIEEDHVEVCAPGKQLRDRQGTSKPTRKQGSQNVWRFV